MSALEAPEYAEGRSYLVGLIGSGVGPSLSPPLHEGEADAQGLRYLYRRLDLDALGLPATAIGDVLTAARLTGYNGVNVTHPCKQLALKHLDALSAEAEELGAVNTVVFTDGRSVGHNTDVSGFARGFDLGLPNAALDEVVLLGAGGAGAAVAHALLGLGVTRLIVFDRDRVRSAGLVASLCARFGTGRAKTGHPDSHDLADALSVANGMVHATPTGMRGHAGLPLPIDLLRPRLWVAEVVYRPLETELVARARERGCRVLDGGRMAVFQAADSFQLFTGREADRDRILRHFDVLAERDRQVVSSAGG